MSTERIPIIPDDWAVWAFSDAHGVTSGFVAALQEAGLIDRERHWIAPPRTALVGCGDYIDRGGDVAGLLGLMQRLADEAAASGSATHYALGNHEAMPLMVRDHDRGALDMWLEYGGTHTLAAFGCDTTPGREPAVVSAEMERRAPGLTTWLDHLPPAVRWRDVLFVHGGLVPGFGLDDLGSATQEHIWIREAFYAAAWDGGGFDAYRDDGIDRVVFGHTPQPDGPRTFHRGHSLNIDTNAVGNPDLPDGARRAFTLLGLRDRRSFDDATVIAIDTADAPERLERRSERDSIG